MPPQMIVAARLWKKKSERTGKTYLAGRLGGLRIVIMARSAGGDAASDHTHEMLVTSATSQSSGVNGAATPRQYTRGRRSRPVSGPKDQRIDDDPYPF